MMFVEWFLPFLTGNSSSSWSCRFRMFELILTNQMYLNDDFISEGLSSIWEDQRLTVAIHRLHCILLQLTKIWSLRSTSCVMAQTNHWKLFVILFEIDWSLKETFLDFGSGHSFHLTYLFETSFFWISQGKVNKINNFLTDRWDVSLFQTPMDCAIEENNPEMAAFIEAYVCFLHKFGCFLSCFVLF